MEQIEKKVDISEIDNELPHLLDEISFSYMMVDSARRSLDDLDRSIKELGDLVDYLREQA